MITSGTMFLEKFETQEIMFFESHRTNKGT